MPKQKLHAHEEVYKDHVSGQYDETIFRFRVPGGWIYTHTIIRFGSGCRPGSGWNWAWRILREHEGIVSGCEVNRLIAGLYGERLPSIDLAHVDLSRGEQRPEQHGCGVC